MSETQKYEPVLAQSGQAGWERLQSARPSAVILDIFMPEMDGFQIIDKMREDADFKEIPVIVVSGGNLTSTEQEKLNELNHHLIEKGTLDADGLLEALDRTLKQISQTKP